MISKIFFRVDASAQTGMGHLVRCIALARMINECFAISFICKEITTGMASELENNGLSLTTIQSEEDFFQNIQSNDIVVLDGYQFDTDYQKRIKSIGSKLVCIDDLHDKVFYADLIINHVPGVKAEDYRAQPYTEFALGLDYSLLRPSFLKQATFDRPLKPISNIFICFGGSDSRNLTAGVLQAVLKFWNFEQIVVVTGNAYNYSHSIEAIGLADKRVKYFHNVNEDRMLELLKQAHLAIVPASGILLEVLTLKIPVITGAYIDNQKIFVKQFAKYKHIFITNSFTEPGIANTLSQVLKASISISRVVDGYSGKRIRTLFENLNGVIYIITGANRGLGNALAELLLENSNNLVVSISRGITEKQKTLVTSGRFLFIEQDLSKSLDYNELKQIKNKVPFNSKIVFINNAGTINPLGEISEIEDLEIKDSIHINVVTPVLLFKFMLTEFPNNFVHLVNISSGAANKSIANWSIYSASKAFTNRFMEVVKEELKDSCKRKFSTIDPGLMDTEMQHKIRSSLFPMVDQFENAKMNGQLRSPLEAATRVLNLIGIA